MRVKIVSVGILILILGLYTASWKVVDYVKETEPWDGKSIDRPDPEAVYEKWPGQVGHLVTLVGILVVAVGFTMGREPKGEPTPVPAPEPEPEPEPEAKPAKSRVPAQTEAPKPEPPDSSNRRSRSRTYKPTNPNLHKR